MGFWSALGQEVTNSLGAGRSLQFGVPENKEQDGHQGAMTRRTRKEVGVISKTHAWLLKTGYIFLLSTELSYVTPLAWPSS